jgi:hypothetical protein
LDELLAAVAVMRKAVTLGSGEKNDPELIHCKPNKVRPDLLSLNDGVKLLSGESFSKGNENPKNAFVYFDGETKPLSGTRFEPSEAKRPDCAKVTTLTQATTVKIVMQ